MHFDKSTYRLNQYPDHDREHTINQEKVSSCTFQSNQTHHRQWFDFCKLRLVSYVIVHYINGFFGLSVFFRMWLLSLENIFEIIRVVMHVSSLFIFMTDQGFIICLCFANTDGHLGCFQFGAIIIKSLGAFIFQKKKFHLIWCLSIMIEGFIHISHIVPALPVKNEHKWYLSRK